MAPAKLRLMLATCIFFLMAPLAVGQLIRDEQLILDLLSSGTVDLSKDVAKVMAEKESQRKIRRIGLESNDLRIRAAFRDTQLPVAASKKLRVKYFDTYYNELAAYIISKQLGLNIVPVTVLRSIGISKTGLQPRDKLRQGTLQLWIENSYVEYDLGKNGIAFPGDPATRNQQLKEIRIFDCIIGNVDRHAGNLLIDFSPRYEDPANEQEPFLGKIWAIDHSKAFHRSAKLSDQHCKLSELTVQSVSLAFIQGIRSWQLVEAEETLRTAGLSEKQLSRLHLDVLEQRLAKVQAHLEAEQLARKLSDEEFYSSGVWHKVW
jgi:hypothetical protein